MQCVVNGMTNAATKAGVEANQFKQAKRKSCFCAVHEIKSQHGSRPGGGFYVFFKLVFYGENFHCVEVATIFRQTLLC